LNLAQLCQKGEQHFAGSDRSFRYLAKRLQLSVSLRDDEDKPPSIVCFQPADMSGLMGVRLQRSFPPSALGRATVIVGGSFVVGFGRVLGYLF
jgi:hypothetical protein|tara:strand:- start:66 stop:344 length:279 start_codon:yes stop_codon:yes gene_type:complete